MTAVERVRVGDVLRLERREVTIDPLKDYHLVGVYSFGKGIFHRDPKTGGELGDYRFFRIEPDDLVLSNIQAWEGAIGHATELDCGTVGTHRFLTYVPATPRIDTNWARWFFLSEPGMRLIRTAAPGTAVRNRTLAIRRFENLEIPLPAIDEQRRIARLLGRAQTGASAIRRLSERAVALSSATGIALTSPVHLTDHQREYCDWECVPLAELMRASGTRVAVDPLDEYRLAGIYSFGGGLIDRGRIVGADTAYKSLTVLHENDVVISKLNGWEGAIAVVDSAFAGAWVSPEFPTFTLDQTRLLPAFFRGISRSPSFWATLNASTRGSMVRRRRISAEEFLRATIWLPHIATQATTAERLVRLDQVAERRVSAQRRILATLPSLLNRAFPS